MASQTRALNFPIRVTGAQAAAAEFAQVKGSAVDMVTAIQQATAAQAAHESAVARSSDAAAALGAAQAQLLQTVTDLKSQLKAGTIDQAEFSARMQDAKNGVALFKAENTDAAKAVNMTARELVAAQKAALDYAAAMKSAEAASAAAPVQVDTRTPAQKLVAGDASVDRAAVSATTLEQVLGRVANKGREVTTVLKETAAAGAQEAAAADTEAQRLDNLRAKYDLRYAVIRKYLQAQAEIRAANAAGVLSEDQMTAAIARERQAALAAVTSIKQHGETIVRTNGQIQFGTVVLGEQLRQIATEYSLNIPAMQIFAQQSGQTLQAITLMTNGASKLGRFLQGPWGIAITVGTVILGPLIAKLFETGDATQKAVDKLKEDARQTEITRKAKVEFAKTMEGVTTAIYDQQAALDKTVKSLESETQQSYEAAKANLAHEIQIRNTTEALLEQAKAQAEVLISSTQYGAGVEGGGAQAAGIQAAEDKIASLEKQLSDNSAAIEVAKANLTNARSLYSVEQGKRLADSLEVIKQKYEGANGLIEKARQRAVAEGKVGDQLQRQVKLLEEQEQKELAAAQQAKHAGNDIAGQASVGDMTALLQQLFPGVHITSTTGGKHVANSDHYAGRAIDFVPAGGMGEFSKAEVERMLEDAGVKIRRNASGVKQFFGPGDPGHNDHFHVAWSGSASPEEAQRIAEKLQREQQRQQEQAIRRQEQFDSANASMDAQVLQARMASLTDIDKIADLQKQQVGIETDKFNAEVEAKVKLGDLTVAQAAELELKRKTLAELDIQAIDRRLQTEKLAQINSLLTDEADTLKVLAEIEPNARERAKLEAQALAIQQQIQATLLEQQIAEGKIADAAQARLDLETQQAAARRKLQIQNFTPGQSYVYNLTNDVTNTQDAIEQTKVDGIKALNDGLVDAIANFHSLGSVARGVLQTVSTDIIRMGVEKYITLPLAKAAGLGGASKEGGGAELLAAGASLTTASGALTSSAAVWQATAAQILTAAQALASSGGGGGGGGDGGFFGSVFSFGSSLFGGGGLDLSGASLAGGTSGAFAGAGAFDFSAFAGFARGAFDVPEDRPFLVGENGVEMMRRERSGRLSVLNGPRTHRMLSEGGQQGGGTVINNITVPERADPRLTSSSIARATQRAIADANRKGLAAPGKKR